MAEYWDVTNIKKKLNLYLTQGVINKWFRLMWILVIWMYKILTMLYVINGAITFVWTVCNFFLAGLIVIVYVFL